MKNFNKILTAGLMILVSLNIMAQNVSDRKAKQAALTAERVNNKDFRFNANYIMPAGLADRTPSDDYDLTVNKDTITAYLPFLGRAYTASPYGLADIGIKFTWTNFTYEVTPTKKNGFEIVIKPAKQDVVDPNGVAIIRLSVGANGSASLQVNNLNRTPISYMGVIEARQDKDGKPIPLAIADR